MRGKLQLILLAVMGAGLALPFVYAGREQAEEKRDEWDAVREELQFIRNETDRLMARMTALERAKDSLVVQIIWIEREKERLWKPAQKK